MRRAAGAMALASALGWAADPLGAPVPFSAMATGPLAPPWRELRIAKVKASEIALVADEGATVLRVRSSASAGSAAQSFRVPAAGAHLAWRWKVDRVVERADLARRDGDDFAARVYVFFDVPRRGLPLATRAKIALVELLYGETIPTAAICYVWDNRHPVGTSAWNPYSDRVRTVVLRSGEAGVWRSERRDLATDFRAAFGTEPPPVTGVAAGNDTDQTGDMATAWFGDFRVERP